MSLRHFEKHFERRRRPRNTTRILVIDDEPNIRYALEEMIQATGCRSFSAPDGEEGLFLARQTLPDLIVSDVMMPKVNGYELCQAIKYDPKTKHIPVVLVTVRGMVQDITLGEDVGADAYVVKPFQAKELKEAITSLLPGGSASRPSSEPSSENRPR